MLDDHLAMDHSKLTYISRRANGERLIQDALQEKDAITIQRLASRFGVADTLCVATEQKTSFLASLPRQSMPLEVRVNFGDIISAS